MNAFTRSLVGLLASTVLISACSPKNQVPGETTNTNVGLRALTEDERLRDFDLLAQAVKENYGPLKYKEKRFGFKLSDLIATYRPRAAAARDDAEMFGVIKEFLTRLQDGHVGIDVGPQTISRYSVPLMLTPVEDKVLIAQISDEALSDETGIEVGDEVVEVDGKAPLSYLPTILKYESMGNELSDRHWLIRLLARPTYMTDLLPNKPTVSLKLKKPSGEEMQRTLVWKVEKAPGHVERQVVGIGSLKSVFSEGAQEIIKASLAHFGEETPFFVTPQVEASFGFTLVKPSEKYLKRYGVEDPKKVPPLWAALYRYDGKTLLLIRQATYMVEDPLERIAWYKAVLDEYGRLADALVIDQTHNPGGSVDYAHSFVSLFAKQQTRGIVNFLKADRRWLGMLGEFNEEEGVPTNFKGVLELAYKLVESAYDKGLDLTESPISLTGGDYLVPASDFHFEKPTLMLVDELAGSCGDLVPLMMKENRLAVLFGERTIGLGGNIEPVLRLPVSQVNVRLTRGLFTLYSPDGKYDLQNPIENNGVIPNIPYKHTVDDTRGGYIEYVTAFSKAATQL